MPAVDRRRFAVASLVLKLIRQALPALVVASIIPLGLFYVVLAAASVQWAMGASVLYATAMVVWQYLRHRQVSGLLVVTFLTATLRAGLALVSGHPFIYFALPAAETAVFGLVFVATLAGSEPLLVRLARDLLPAGADRLAANRPLIRNLSVMWAASHVLSAGATMLLLLTTPLTVFLAVHVFANWVFIGAAGGASVWLVRSRDRDLLTWLMAALREAAVDPGGAIVEAGRELVGAAAPTGAAGHEMEPVAVPAAA